MRERAEKYPSEPGGGSVCQEIRRTVHGLDMSASTKKPGDHSKAERRASALLKNGEFRAKYPALAQALSESVGVPASPFPSSPASEPTPSAEDSKTTFPSGLAASALVGSTGTTGHLNSNASSFCRGVQSLPAGSPHHTAASRSSATSAAYPPSVPSATSVSLQNPGRAGQACADGRTRAAATTAALQSRLPSNPSNSGSPSRPADSPVRLVPAVSPGSTIYPYSSLGTDGHRRRQPQEPDNSSSADRPAVSTSETKLSDASTLPPPSRISEPANERRGPLRGLAPVGRGPHGSVDSSQAPQRESSELHQPTAARSADQRKSDGPDIAEELHTSEGDPGAPQNTKGGAGCSSSVEVQPPASRYIPPDVCYRAELSSASQSDQDACGHTCGGSAPRSKTRHAGLSQPPLEPPQHYMHRLEELQRQYAGAIQARKTVEYQYQLFRSLDRPPILVPPPPRSSFVPATPTPSTYAGLPPALPAQLQQLQVLYQQRQKGLSSSWKPGDSFLQTRASSVHPPGRLSEWQTTAPPPFCPALAGSGKSPGHEVSRVSGSALPASSQVPATLTGVSSQVAGQRATGDWHGLGPVQQQKMVNPALVFVKETMDQVLQQLRSESVSLQNQSREIGLKLVESKEKSEIEKWRSMGVNELLCEMSEEQQAFIKEQLRAIDQAKTDLETMKGEADRIECHTRDAFYRSLYAAGANDEEVQEQKEQLRRIEELKQQLPSTSGGGASVCDYVTQSGGDPLEKLNDLNLGYNLESLPARRCKAEVNALLRQMGYRHSEKPVPVRRSGYPAQYFSKFPELYPYPEYAAGLPASQQAVQERLLELKQKGDLSGAVNALRLDREDESTAENVTAAALLREEQVLMQEQRRKQDEEQDWEQFFRAKREARERALAEEAAKKAREEAARAAEEARQAVELLVQRQRAAEAEAAAAERKAAAENEAARAAERKADAERQALELAEKRRREQADEERERARTRKEQEARAQAEREAEEKRKNGEESNAAEEILPRRPSRSATGVQRIGTRRQATLTVAAAEELADRMRRDPSMRRKRSLATPRARVEEGIQPKPSTEAKEEAGLGEGGPPLGMQRTLTMYKTPLSRTLSMAHPGGGAAVPKGDAQRLLLDKQEPTMDDRKELNSVEIPEKLLAAGLTVMPVQNKKKAELLSNSALAKRLPYQKCESFVHLTPPAEPRNDIVVYERYKDIKELLATGRLGLKAKAQAVYDFAFACCKKVVRDDPRSQASVFLAPALEVPWTDPDNAVYFPGTGFVSCCFRGLRVQEYANVLMEAIPYYPYQIDIQRAGVIAFLNIFEHCKYQEQLAVPLFDCLTTLMAIDDEELRGDVVAVMAAVIRPQVVINSHLVDELLVYIEKVKDAQLCSYGLHVLLVARSPHRKDAQYAVFVRLLEKWKFEPTVPTRACLAIDSFAKRARQEGLAQHHRKKHMADGVPIEVSEGLDKFQRGLSYAEDIQVLDNSQPPVWINRHITDVQQIVMVMDRHPQHRRLQGAACQALASLAGVSLPHCEHVARLGLSRVYTATLNHKESQTIAMSLCSLIALLASVRQCRAALQPKMVDMVRQFIGRHRNVSEVLAAACAALTKLDTLFPLTNESLERLTLAIIVNNLRNSSDQTQVVVATADFIQRVAGKVGELSEVRERLVELDAVEALVKGITVCSMDIQACQLGCRAVSHLVYGQPHSSRIYADLVRLRAMTAFLFVLLKHHKSAPFCRDALCCIANCASYGPCAEAVMERGINVVCKAMDTNVADIEVVAQGCRCLGFIAAQPALKATAQTRAEAIISYAAEEFSKKPETRQLLSQFLTDIFNQRGVTPQLIEPLWNPSEPFA
ncbi:hypothetical protein CSUI_009743, partial [Cystoisospora suis]